MASIGALYDQNRQAVLDQLRLVRRGCGPACAGVVSEALMSAVTEFVRESEGPEAAFNVLTRHADAAIAPTVEQRAQSQHHKHR